MKCPACRPGTPEPLALLHYSLGFIQLFPCLIAITLIEFTVYVCTVMLLVFEEQGTPERRNLLRSSNNHHMISIQIISQLCKLRD